MSKKLCILSRLVITIVVAVLICVFSVATSQAVDPRNKERVPARRSLKTIIVDNYQPYTFMNEKGSPDGFSVEMIKAVAAVMDLDLEIRPGTWEQATKELERGTIDLLPMMAHSVERDKKFDFSVPHTIAYDAIFSRNGDKSLGSLKELSGKTVIVMNKDAAHDYLLSSGLSETMRLQLVDSLPEALRQLSSGKGDAAIMPKLVGILTLKKLNLSNIDPSPPVIDRYTRPFSLAVRKGDQALLERLNQGLGIIKDTGQYDAIYKKWFGALEEPRIPWKSALQLISLGGIFLIAFAAWNVSLKHQVKSRTKGLEAEVAERRLKEEALRESEERYRSLFGKASDGIFLMSPDGKLIEVNESFARMHGYSTGELLQMNVKDLDTPKSAELIPERMHRLLAGEILTVEVEHHHRDGHVFPLEVSANLISIGGEPFIQCFHRDITERKRAEEAISHASERLLLATRAGGVGIWELDAVTNNLIWDDQMFTLYGITSDTFGGTYEAWRAGVHPEDLPQGEAELQMALRGEKEFDTEFRVVWPDGTVHHIRALAHVHSDASGKPTSVIGTNYDITELKRAEEEKSGLEAQLQQAQKLESLGVLAGGIAHDFNNILMAVLGHAELAIERISPMSPARGNLAEITKASRRAADLCRQMLAYAGKAAFALERVGLRELVEEMAHMLKTSISKKAILNLNLERGLPPIEADPSQIRQIVMNLIINASEAIGDRSGVITVSVGATRCDDEYLRKTELRDDLAPGLYVHLEVTDTGGGMDAQTRSRIFEPFFSTKFTGRGLGLAAVLGIVRAHKGALKLYSEPGKGTTFKILFLAMTEGEDAARSPESSPLADWRGKGTILLVDDEESLVALGARMLEHLGFSVLTAADGLQAVDLYRERGEEIDLVLMDLTMPHMDGAEAFGELRRLNPEVRVVLASGYSHEDVASRFAGKSLSGVLQKPYTLAKLRESLAGLMPKRQDAEG